MPRKAAIIPNKRLHTTLPPELATKLDLFLWSEVEGRIPQGAYQQFICEAIQRFFSHRTIDIGPKLGEARTVSISGSPEDLSTLLSFLESRNA